MISQTIIALVTLRKQIIDDIYQLTGMADIMRGDTDPDETLGAQQLKTQYGTTRIRDKQQELVRLARDLVEISCEIMTQKFKSTTMIEMSQTQLPTTRMVEQQVAQLEQQLQQQIAQFQQQMAPRHRPLSWRLRKARQGCPPARRSAPPGGPSPGGHMPMPDQQQQRQQQMQQAQTQLEQMVNEIEQTQQQVTIEQVLAFLKDNRAKSFVLDIETDSTIMADENGEKQRRTEFVGVLGQLLPQLAQMIQADPTTAKFCGALLKFATAPFRAGRELDGAIDELVQNMEAKGQGPQAPDPTTAQGQIMLQVEAMKDRTVREKNATDAAAQVSRAADEERPLPAAAANQIQIKQMDICGPGRRPAGRHGGAGSEDAGEPRGAPGRDGQGADRAAADAAEDAARRPPEPDEGAGHGRARHRAAERAAVQADAAAAATGRDLMAQLGYGIAPAPPAAPTAPLGYQSALAPQMAPPATALDAINQAIGIAPQQQADPNLGITMGPATMDTAPTPGITANDAVSQGFSAMGFGTGTLGQPGEGFSDGFGAGASAPAGIAPGGTIGSESPGTLGGGYGMGLGNSSVGSATGAISGIGLGNIGDPGADAPGPAGFCRRSRRRHRRQFGRLRLRHQQPGRRSRSGSRGLNSGGRVMPIGDLARSDEYLLDDQPSRYPTASNMSIQPNYPPPAPPVDARWLADAADVQARYRPPAELPDVGAPLISPGPQISAGQPWANRAADVMGGLLGAKPEQNDPTVMYRTASPLVNITQGDLNRATDLALTFSGGGLKVGEAPLSASAIKARAKAEALHGKYPQYAEAYPPTGPTGADVESARP